MHLHETYIDDRRRRSAARWTENDIPWQDIAFERKQERASVIRTVGAATSHLARPLRGTGVRLVRLAERLEA